MNKNILLILISLVSGNAPAHAGTCNQWQYASLSFTSNASVNNKELKSVSTFVLWEAPNEHGIWQNNKPLSGTIKSTLTQHFGIKAVHAHSVLNKLGLDGWEAYGFHAIQISDKDQTKQWQFKKCIK